jgi:hypothetical protein
VFVHQTYMSSLSIAKTTPLINVQMLNYSLERVITNVQRGALHTTLSESDGGESSVGFSISVME